MGGFGLALPEMGPRATIARAAMFVIDFLLEFLFWTGMVVADILDCAARSEERQQREKRCRCGHVITSHSGQDGRCIEGCGCGGLDPV